MSDRFLALAIIVVAMVPAPVEGQAWAAGAKAKKTVAKKAAPAARKTASPRKLRTNVTEAV